MPDVTDKYYIRNWFVTLDLMCTAPGVYNGIASYYFLGYGFGAILCFIPQIYGRKRSMTFILLANIVTNFLIVFYPSIAVKKMAYFIFGFFHIKVSLSYTHMFELIEDKHRVFCSTIITGLDVLTIAVTCFYYKYVSSDMDDLYSIIFTMGLTCCVFYMILVPESPQWLFMNRGSNSQEAIAILNYIARFNGSKNKIPYDANFDILGQYIEEQSAKFTNTFSNHGNQSSYISRVHCNKSKMTVLINPFTEMKRTL